MADRVSAWISSLWGGSQLEEYWTHPEAFPLLLAPWWVEEKLSRNPVPPLQAELVYSSMMGYYHIRLIDNVMDGDVATDLVLLPILGFFHTQFEGVYRRLFHHGDPFWEAMLTLWFRCAEVTMLDGSMTDFDLTHFVEIAAQKTSAAKIPVAAVAYKYGRSDLLPSWFRFLDRFSCWSQMFNDTFDWLDDSFHHKGTFFLSEATRRKRDNESLFEWVLRDGLEWGMDTLETWMSELKIQAKDLDCPDAVEYLDRRSAALAQRRAVITEGLSNLSKLRSVLDGSLQE
ncbi:MAG: hypothetical protein JO071_13295 [Deltaproteobacteria bacterium]|nr:hypothetical protein [Deltaproteobacteria bacterium]